MPLSLGSRLNVLVLDDDPEDRELIRDFLGSSGPVCFDISEAGNSSEAEDILRKHLIDVALVDYRLGNENGVNFIRDHMGKTSSPAMILLTGQGDEQTDFEAVHAGASNYIEKGDITPDSLSRAIRFAAMSRQVLTLQENARIAAEDLARAKSDLLAQISHDFRTPLNAIIGFSDMIGGEMLGPASQAKYMEFAKLISQSGHHLLSLVNQLLLATQLDQGTLILDAKPVDITEIGRQTIRMLETLARDKNISLEAASPTPVVQMADERSIRQIIINLLSNAVKFTDEGSVRLEIVRDDAGAVRIAVTDTGPGIRQEEIGRLTEAFYQSGSDSNKARAGTGLGLAIVHGLVEAHNGRLMIDSELGKGSVFTVTLPPLKPAVQADQNQGSE